MNGFDDSHLTDRARAWAATMHGHDLGEVVRAHTDSAAAVGAGEPVAREAREEHEAAWLADGATRAIGAGHRARPEEPDAERTCFERDRDRILHRATAFRRLAGKTQVFIFPEDHQRTRLTHALEVAQVATSIARACRLNVALAEAIALGHDCGHGPFGHASEDAFAPYLPGGYDHAVWGADVVLAPLNLCVETLDGIRNHSWSRPAPATPEGEVVSWADRIAYVCHDFEDAASTGLVAADHLPDEVRGTCGTTRAAQLRAFVTAMIDAGRATGRIGMGAAHAEALAAFRKFNYDAIYMRDASRRQAARVVDLLRALVEHYHARPAAMAAAIAPQYALPSVFPRLTYREAMERYGSDKPDLRPGMPIQDVREVFRESSFGVFKGIVAEGGTVRAIVVPDAASYSRSAVDAIVNHEKAQGRHLLWARRAEDGTITSSFPKAVGEETVLGDVDGDVVPVGEAEPLGDVEGDTEGETVGLTVGETVGVTEGEVVGRAVPVGETEGEDVVWLIHETENQTVK